MFKSLRNAALPTWRARHHWREISWRLRLFAPKRTSHRQRGEVTSFIDEMLVGTIYARWSCKPTKPAKIRIVLYQLIYEYQSTSKRRIPCAFPLPVVQETNKKTPSILWARKVRELHHGSIDSGMVAGG
jgi:hypothetical protein